MTRAVLKAKSSASTLGNRTTRIRSEKRIEMLNQKLSSSIDVDKLFADVEPLVIGENGVVMNFDPNNPQHRKWLDD
ncbi:hypothetical protein P4S83_11910 [Aneurinibacillus thermoaerophilus]|uniref:hypothetical protein n=1 Tax=Aneurinibacillus thermoaerophilus TaxID=143495 RepID=UPI002E1C22F7|nr:hypothetical protein [Aneurinibacillus thermoaerophilus]MED0763348.1 hypothetical protein [Aneurinibacillus thermoaerophilus]